MSLCYVLIRWLLQSIALGGRSKEFKELELVAMRHELAILRRTTRRPAVTAVDQVFLAAASCQLPPYSRPRVFARMGATRFRAIGGH